mmetsp:Transcript_118678/g.335682  ORF Transcript_118678/g.335682 Transcript_118678/m.335682 type:complete len:260 (+) Transcript_118678:123-902(+)
MEKVNDEAPVATPQQDHEDHMQLGFRIITSVFTNKMTSLDQEIRGMRLACDEQRSNIASLQKKSSALEVELVEGHQVSQKLQDENQELFKTVESLRRQVARLEALKASVFASIQDDVVQEAELGNTRVIMNEEYLRAATPLTFRELGAATKTRTAAALSAPAALAAPPTQQDSPQEPSKVDKHAEPEQGNDGVNGKAFFRMARSALSYESFNLFLASIKRLNNQKQTREETLEEARRIFGPELQNLYQDFETLLNRHGV